MIPYKQLSFADIFSNCQNIFNNDKHEFLELLSHTIDFDKILPASYISHFYAATGILRRHQLYLML